MKYDDTDLYYRFMRMGLDVGGTHTDAVIVGREGIISSAKVATDHDDLLLSVLAAFREVIRDVDPARIEAVTLSTTLTTNALLEGKTDRVGVVVSSGPGIDPAHHKIGDDFFVVEGAIDHRGEERKTLDMAGLAEILAECRSSGIRSFAVATKFSTRNPQHELLMEKHIKADADVVTAGHRLSGSLNFPRRINTAYFNSAVWGRYNEFSLAAEACICGLGISAPVNVLKADGGTMPLAVSRDIPVQSILSGPAASIMGITALYSIDRDTLVLDIGGTSTDMSIFAAGLPLLEPKGISLNGRPTLVRSLKSESIAIGGDSSLRIEAGKITVGPDRSGPCMAAGGSTPALLDALNIAGETAFGDKESSRRGISDLAIKAGRSAERIADEAIDAAIVAIATAAGSMIDEINERPVYTVQELLHPEKVVPSRLFIIGGPAQAFSKRLSRALGLEAIVPELHGVANAIGAALTRATMEIELFADTERGILLVPRLSVQKEIGKNYSIEEAVNEAKRYLLDYSGYEDVSDVQVTEASTFNMIDGSRLAGRNIRVRCQIRPGLVRGYPEGMRVSI